VLHTLLSDRLTVKDRLGPVGLALTLYPCLSHARPSRFHRGSAFWGATDRTGALHLSAAVYRLPAFLCYPPADNRLSLPARLNSRTTLDVLPNATAGPGESPLCGFLSLQRFPIVARSSFEGSQPSNFIPLQRFAALLRYWAPLLFADG